MRCGGPDLLATLWLPEAFLRFARNLVNLPDLGVHALESQRCLMRRTQLVTSTTAPYCSAEDVNCWFELPKSELPEAFPRFSEDSFEATLPRGGCRGLQARPLHLVAAGSSPLGCTQISP